MTTMKNFVICQEQQKEHACKQRFIVMPLWMSERGWKSFAPFGSR